MGRPPADCESGCALPGLCPSLLQSTLKPSSEVERLPLPLPDANHQERPVRGAVLPPSCCLMQAPISTHRPLPFGYSVLLTQKSPRPTTPLKPWSRVPCAENSPVSFLSWRAPHPQWASDALPGKAPSLCCHPQHHIKLSLCFQPVGLLDSLLCLAPPSLSSSKMLPQ